MKYQPKLWWQMHSKKCSTKTKLCIQVNFHNRYEFGDFGKFYRSSSSGDIYHGIMHFSITH